MAVRRSQSGSRAPISTTLFTCSEFPPLKEFQRELEYGLKTREAGQPILDVLASMKSLARAQETLYAIHEFPPLSRYFVEPEFHSSLERLDPPRREGLSVGLHHTGGEAGAEARGQLGAVCDA